MPAILVRELSKTFITKRKASGLRGSLRALFRPERYAVEAVQDIPFEMEARELLGFIGSNGAGKSTTIKILTSILFPSGEHAEVLREGCSSFLRDRKY
ncbi:MAG: ATP-binding cassette domain-containing protein [Chloroflexota bacterium]